MGILVVFAVLFVVVMWPLSFFGHLLGLTPTLGQLLHHNHVWEHQHYPLVGLRYLGVIGVLIGGLVAFSLLIALIGSLSARKADEPGRAVASGT
jgi:ABC-type phosphate/phosphonate transport system permease subunit